MTHEQRQKIENGNFYKALIAHGCMIIGYASLEIVLLYLLVQSYHASSAVLGFFGAIAAVPATIIGFLAPVFDRITARKKWLILMQLLEITSIFLLAVCLISKQTLYLVACLDLLLVTVSTVSNTLEIGFIPEILFEDEAKIEKTVDVQYVLSSGLSILTGLFSSPILLFVGFRALIVISIIASALGIFFYLLIKDILPNSSNINLNYIDNGETVNDQKKAKSRYVQRLLSDGKQFLHAFPAIIIIFTEAILGGITGLLFQLLPITMKELGIPVALFSLVDAVQQAGDAAGGFIAPFIKVRLTTFFILDYLFSGICFVLIGFSNMPNIIRIILLLLASIVMGMSGNVFEKLMYRSFNMQNISAMHAIATSVFSLFSIIGYLGSLIQVGTLMFWTTAGLLSIFFGLLLVIMQKKMDS